MTNLTFWDADHDSITAMAESLSSYDLAIEHLFQRGYTQPEIDVPGGVPGFASSTYKQLKALPLKNADRIYALALYQVFTANKDGSSLVGICLLHPMHKRFNQLYLVASKQKYLGIYMDGEPIAEVLKSSPVIVPDMLRPYLLGVPSRDLDTFCREASEVAATFLSGIKTFEI